MSHTRIGTDALSRVSDDVHRLILCRLWFPRQRRVETATDTSNAIIDTARLAKLNTAEAPSMNLKVRHAVKRRSSTICRPASFSGLRLSSPSCFASTATPSRSCIAALMPATWPPSGSRPNGWPSSAASAHGFAAVLDLWPSNHRRVAARFVISRCRHKTFLVRS